MWLPLTLNVNVHRNKQNTLNVYYGKIKQNQFSLEENKKKISEVVTARYKVYFLMDNCYQMKIRLNYYLNNINSLNTKTKKKQQKFTIAKVSRLSLIEIFQRITTNCFVSYSVVIQKPLINFSVGWWV